MRLWMWVAAAVCVVGALALALLLPAGSGGGSGGEGGTGSLTISAAISLKPALEKAQPLLEQAAGEKVAFNFGASGTLAGQIQQGAPVDLFLSADRATVQKLLDAKAAEPGTDQPFAGNELVLIYTKVSVDPAHQPAGFADLTRVRKLALGDPKIVPAGMYAMETLTQLKLYDALNKGGQLALAENVAQVVSFVQRGDAEAGIVYATDAKAADKQVTVLATADPAWHSRIEYVGAIIAGSKQRQAAGKVQQALKGTAVQAILREFGFTPPR